MKVAIRYYTRTGNTEKLAKVIEEVTGVEAKKVDNKLEEDVDILFLGSSVYAAGIDNEIKKFIAGIDVNVKKVVSFSTAAMLGSPYKQIEKLLGEKGIVLDTRHFHCKGKFLNMLKDRPNEEDLNNLREFVKDILNKDEQVHL